MDLFEKYYISAVRFLSYRPRSIKEVEDNLKKKNAPQEVMEKILSTLIEQKFLNDHQFTKWFIESRANYKQKSQRFVRMELMQKGISPEVITEVLGEEEMGEVANDLSQAKTLVAKRIGRYKGMEKQEVYAKLGGFLGRRGFSWEIIKRSIDDNLRLEYNDE